MEVLVAVPGRGWALVRCRWRYRLAARIAGGRLDEQLARAVPPESSILLAIRARTLTRMATRDALARQLRRLSSAACSRTLSPAVRPVSWRSVRAVAPDLRLLASQLVQPGPVSAAGVAQASMLVADAWGPGYRATNSLRASVNDVFLALDSRPNPSRP